MELVHSREYLDKGEEVELESNAPCNFMMTDDQNFSLYKEGEAFGYYGGHYASFPVRITAPYSGHWNITVDALDDSAGFRYSLKVLR